MKKQMKSFKCECLSREELAAGNAGIMEDPAAEVCPYDATCPNKYPGCYTGGAAVFAMSACAMARVEAF